MADEEAHRSLALALRIGELLLGAGEATEEVSEAMRVVMRAYGLRHCEADVNMSAISLSDVPGDGRPPVTAERRVRRRQPDYARLILVHALVREIESDELSQIEVRERLREITRGDPVYPVWLVVLALASIAASACFLVGGGSLAALAAFLGTVLGDRASAWMARHGIAEFFQLTVAAVFGSAVAVFLVGLGVPMSDSAAVIGAVIALLPGRAFVATAQDGIAGEYLTAAGRLIEITFIMAAIVSGIGVTISAALWFGLPVSLEHTPVAPLLLSAPQLLGAFGVSLTFGVALMVPPKLLLPGALGGLLIWIVFVELTSHRFPPIMAIALASAAVGLLLTVYATRAGRPALIFIVPAIGPLLPGSALYRSMVDISSGDLNSGIITLFDAASSALAIGAGVALGSELPRFFDGADLTRRVLRPAARRTRG